jgi:hypothetical protein
MDWRVKPGNDGFLRGVTSNPPMLAQKLASLRSQPDHDLASRRVFARGKTAIHRVFPHRQPRARGAPGVDHVGIRARLAADPFEEIEDERV